jgi:hypothetical protein
MRRLGHSSPAASEQTEIVNPGWVAGQEVAGADGVWRIGCDVPVEPIDTRRRKGTA